MTVIHRPAKQGLGTAYAVGFRQALRMGADRIVTMDADLSHDPKYLPALIQRSATCDLAIGSRYVPGGAVRWWGWHRRLLSWGANRIARLALGLRVHDCTAGFRCYRREVLTAIDPAAIKADGYSYLIEMLFLCQAQGFTIEEIPIVFSDRRRGSSKISRKEIFKAVLTVLRLTGTRLRRTAPALAIGRLGHRQRG